VRVVAGALSSRVAAPGGNGSGDAGAAAEADARGDGPSRALPAAASSTGLSAGSAGVVDVGLSGLNGGSGA